MRMWLTTRMLSKEIVSPGVSASIRNVNRRGRTRRSLFPVMLSCQRSDVRRTSATMEAAAKSLVQGSSA